MSSYVPAALRRLVIARAAGRCAYCRFPQQAAFLSFEIEHIISAKHDGPTVAENLALACPYCNDHKGTDLGSLDPETDILTPFFHPRRQEWPRRGCGRARPRLPARDPLASRAAP